MDVLSMLSFSHITAIIIDTMTSTALKALELAAQLSLGQIIFRFVDRILWIVEKTAQWSLPSSEIAADENGKAFGKIELVRPLPWILFLPGLIMLRLFRVGLNIGLFVLGYAKIEPSQMYNFLQKSRRRLRTIKTNGMKHMRQRKVGEVSTDNDSNVKDAKWRSAQLLRSIQMTLSSLSCLDGSKLSPSPPPTRIKFHHESTPPPDEKSTTESAISPIHEESKRKHCEISSEDNLTEDSEEETIQEKIDRLVAVNDSINDEDFNPADCPSADDDSSTSGESNISVTEVQDIQNEVKLMMPRLFGNLEEAINEESETAKNDTTNQRTGADENLDNPSTGYTSENSEEQQDYYSPSKLGEDGETAFYSPISSTSPSPDRMVPISEKNHQGAEPRKISSASNIIIQNGDASGKEQKESGQSSPEPQISDVNEPDSVDKTGNGYAGGKNGGSTNAAAKTMKFHNRGRRSSHASRKKK